MVRPAVVDSPYRRSVADSSAQFVGTRVGTSNLTSVRAFSPMTGSGGLAVGSPTDPARTLSSVIIWKFSSGTTWSTQPSAVADSVMFASSQLRGCPTVHV
jgi:hypothetical protein